MTLLQRITRAFTNMFARKQRDDAWNARYTNPPATADGKLPLDPGKTNLS